MWGETQIREEIIRKRQRECNCTYTSNLIMSLQMLLTIMSCVEIAVSWRQTTKSTSYIIFSMCSSCVGCIYMNKQEKTVTWLAWVEFLKRLISHNSVNEKVWHNAQPCCPLLFSLPVDEMIHLSFIKAFSISEVKLLIIEGITDAC